MSENESEQLVRQILTDRLGLSVRRIPEAPPTPTADFEVSLGSQVLFVAEVKNLKCHNVPTFTVPGSAPGDISEVGHAREDNGPVRVTRHIVAGARQLRGYNVPKVLVLVNDELCMDFGEDFLAGFRGFEQIGTTPDGVREMTYLASPSLRQRLAEAQAVIDLYVWVETCVNDGERDLCCASNRAQGRQIKRYFEPHTIRPSRAFKPQPSI